MLRNFFQVGVDRVKSKTDIAAVEFTNRLALSNSIFAFVAMIYFYLTGQPSTGFTSLGFILVFFLPSILNYRGFNHLARVWTLLAMNFTFITLSFYFGHQARLHWMFLTFLMTPMYLFPGNDRFHRLCVWGGAAIPLVALFFFLPDREGILVVTASTLGHIKFLSLFLAVVSSILQQYYWQRISRDLASLVEEKQLFINRVLTNIPAAMFCKDAKNDFRFTLWNLAAEKQWQLKESQVIGKNDYDFFPKSESDFFRQKDQAILDSGNPEIIEKEEITLGDGSKKYLRTKKVPVEGRYILGISEDITDAIKSAAQLKEVHGKIEAIIHSMVEGLVVQDNQGKVVLLNAAACNILALTPDQILGKTSRDPSWRSIREDGSDFPGCEHPAVIALEKGEVQRGVIIGMYRPSGELRWVSVNSSPLYGADKTKPIQSVTTFQDITEQREQERKIFYSSKMSALGEMSAGVSHEINNPLAIIFGKAQQIEGMLKKGVLDSETLGKHLESIKKTTERIAKIIRGLRTFSRDSTGDPVETVSVDTLLDETLAFCSQRFSMGGVQLESKVTPKGLMLECRPSQISQVILNLLNNAFDAVLVLKERWVRIEITELDEMLKFEVIDSGSGIRPEVVDRIMQPFFTTKSAGVGIGLGLSVALGIVKSHGGRLEVDRNSKNTCFVMLIPKKAKEQVLNPESGG